MMYEELESLLTFEDFESMLGVLLGLLIVGGTFAFGRYKGKRLSRRERYQQHYEAFYGPFFTKLNGLCQNGLKYSEIEATLQDAFYEMIMMNAPILGPNAKNAISAYYAAALDFASRGLSPEGAASCQRIDAAFADFVLQVLVDSKKMCKSLGIPYIGQPLEARLAGVASLCDEKS